MSNVVKTSAACAAFLAAAILLAAVRLPAHGRFDEPSQPLAFVIHDQCTFSDGSTISFGRKALGLIDAGEDVWRTGDYEATVKKRWRRRCGAWRFSAPSAAVLRVLCVLRFYPWRPAKS